VLADRQGRSADALGHNEQALRLYQTAGRKPGEAQMLNNAGWSHALLGNYQQALAFCRQAFALSAEVGSRTNEGCTWHSLGYTEHQLGNLREATACYQRALGNEWSSRGRCARPAAGRASTLPQAPWPDPAP
jgi:tetratricopeptide (TPR) repeat protein